MCEVAVGNRQAEPGQASKHLPDPIQEDKLAGICLWQHHLLRGGGAAAWPRELAALRAVHEQGHVFAWCAWPAGAPHAETPDTGPATGCGDSSQAPSLSRSLPASSPPVTSRSTSDWVSGRLLGPLIKQLLQRGEAGQGEACARATMAWSAAPDVWLRRASAVAFVTLARLPDSQVFPGFRAALVDTLAVTVQGQERWAQVGRRDHVWAGRRGRLAPDAACGVHTGHPHAGASPLPCPPQTGTGWVLRDLGKADTAQLLKVGGRERAGRAGAGRRLPSGRGDTAANLPATPLPARSL